MKFLNFLLLGFVLLIGCSCAGAGIKPPKDTNTQTMSLAEFQYGVTVRIYVKCGKDESTGSGVAVGSDRLVTAQHVIDCAETPEITIKTFDTRNTLAVIIRQDAEMDFAVLSVSKEFFKFWAIPAPIILPLDAVVASIGGDYVVFLCKKTGRVFKQDKEFIFHTIWIKRGNSGGPLFYRGQLVGINVRATMDPMREYAALAIPATLWAPLLLE